jgi:hypothetical protein
VLPHRVVEGEAARLDELPDGDLREELVDRAEIELRVGAVRDGVLAARETPRPVEESLPVPGDQDDAGVVDAASFAAFSTAVIASASDIAGGGPARSESSASSIAMPTRTTSGGGPKSKAHRVKLFPDPSVTTMTLPAAGASARRIATSPVSFRIAASRLARSAAGRCFRPSGETAPEKKAASRSLVAARNASKNAATRRPAGESGRAGRGGSAARTGPERTRTRRANEKPEPRRRSRMKPPVGTVCSLA